MGGDHAHKSEGTGLGLTLGKEVCRTAWRDDLGGERSRQGINIYFHPAPKDNATTARSVDVMKAAIQAASRIKSNSLPRNSK